MRCNKTGVFSVRRWSTGAEKGRRNRRERRQPMRTGKGSNRDGASRTGARTAYGYGSGVALLDRLQRDRNNLDRWLWRQVEYWRRETPGTVAGRGQKSVSMPDQLTLGHTVHQGRKTQEHQPWIPKKSIHISLPSHGTKSVKSLLLGRPFGRIALCGPATWSALTLEHHPQLSLLARGTLETNRMGKPHMALTEM